MNLSSESTGNMNSASDGKQPVSQTSGQAPPLPSASPHPLDGSQYHNVIEEQVYAEQPPSAEEQKPWRISHPEPVPSDKASHEAPSISVGTR